VKVLFASVSLERYAHAYVVLVHHLSGASG
jgi:hypothetical protein